MGTFQHNICAIFRTCATGVCKSQTLTTNGRRSKHIIAKKIEHKTWRLDQGLAGDCQKMMESKDSTDAEKKRLLKYVANGLY